MANINAPGIEFFESFAHEIESKFQRIKTLVPYRVASGDYHEAIIRTVLRNFLTKRYSVKKGFIYKYKNEVSRQDLREDYQGSQSMQFYQSDEV